MVSVTAERIEFEIVTRASANSFFRLIIGVPVEYVGMVALIQLRRTFGLFSDNQIDAKLESSSIPLGR